MYVSIPPPPPTLTRPHAATVAYRRQVRSIPILTVRRHAVRYYYAQLEFIIVLFNTITSATEG